MKDLPWELIEKIMKFKGAYDLDQRKRPYITTLHYLGNIIQYGVKRAIIHHKEIEALEQSYADSVGGYPIPVLRPKHSPFHQP